MSRRLTIIMRLSAALSVCLLLFTSSFAPLYAQDATGSSTEDFNSIYGDSTFFSNSADCTSPPPPTTSTGGLAANSKLYILGDSITVRTAPLYTSGFSAKSISTTISAVSGRSWVSPGNPSVGTTGTQGTGQEAATKDSDAIKAANGIVIALGTNGYSGGNPIQDILSAVRASNPSAPIWWVNVANGPPGNSGVPAFDKELDDTASSGKIQVINWKNVVDPGGDGTHNPTGILEDGTHPNMSGGTQKLADLVVGAVTSGAAPTAANTNSTCQCSGSTSAVSTVLPPAVPEPYRSLFSAAAAKFNVNPSYLTALFLTENGNTWKPFDTKWPSSSAGASGPFQFEPGTWSTYKTDGDGDGNADINNIKDAAYSAANLISKGTDVSTPLGDLNKPFAPGTILYNAAAYNWGGGNLQTNTKPDSPLSAAPQETQNYLINVSSLINSGFTHSDYKNYGDPHGAPGVDTAGSTGGGTSTTPATSCTGSAGGGVVAGSIVQTAIGLAWDKNVGDATPPYKNAATTAYQDALPKFESGDFGGDLGFTDCSRFVATVMKASGVDTNYPAVLPSADIAYVRAHPEKYDIIENVNDTSQLKPGDILISSGHTYIFVGTQPNGLNIREASYAASDSPGRVPQSRNFWVTPGAYIAARVKS